MGKGTELYKYLPGMDNEWVFVSDLAAFGITKISRLASRKNSLVVVDTP